MEKFFDELQIKDAFRFSVILRNTKFCKHFLERILNIKISCIEYLKSQETIDRCKKCMDIYVKDGKETLYNIEMQTTENRNLPKRTRYFQEMIALNILEKGDN